jgi:hypothetical protein
VLPAVLAAEPEPLAGLSLLSLTLWARCCGAGGVLACTGGGLALEDTESVEPLLEMPPEVFFLDRVLVLPTEWPDPEPRLRFLMTSVFKLRGRTTP